MFHVAELTARIFYGRYCLHLSPSGFVYSACVRAFIQFYESSKPMGASIRACILYSYACILVSIVSVWYCIAVRQAFAASHT